MRQVLRWRSVPAIGLAAGVALSGWVGAACLLMRDQGYACHADSNCPDGQHCCANQCQTSACAHDARPGDGLNGADLGPGDEPGVASDSASGGDNGASSSDDDCVPTSAEVCNNYTVNGSPIDDDCDGLANCQSPACQPAASDPFGAPCSPAGRSGMFCTSVGDCVCFGSGGLPEPTEQSCDDGFDNDCDSLVDCADPDCNGRACNSSGGFCYLGSCCTPSCGGVCGSNGCGGSCDGTCGGSWCHNIICHPTGCCIPLNDVCPLTCDPTYASTTCCPGTTCLNEHCVPQ